MVNVLANKRKKMPAKWLDLGDLGQNSPSAIRVKNENQL
jgi:hypothetical protein